MRARAVRIMGFHPRPSDTEATMQGGLEPNAKKLLMACPDEPPPSGIAKTPIALSKLSQFLAEITSVLAELAREAVLFCVLIERQIEAIHGADALQHLLPKVGVANAWARLFVDAGVALVLEAAIVGAQPPPEQDERLVEALRETNEGQGSLQEASGQIQVGSSRQAGGLVVRETRLAEKALEGPGNAHAQALVVQMREVALDRIAQEGQVARLATKHAAVIEPWACGVASDPRRLGQPT